MLQLLGDELIGNDRLAVFELVKNAYDADATEATVSLEIAPSSPQPRITVTDDGEGMTLDTLKSVWLVPGDDHRQKQRRSNTRTARHGRLPLGEKGLGRFAVHKLGNRISLVTRAHDSHECVVEIDWNVLTARAYLDEAPVTVKERHPKLFTNGRTGTRIEVRELRRAQWSRRDVRRLHNQITSICSPFQESSGFRAILRVPDLEGWIADLPDVANILALAPWRFSFHADGTGFDWTYEFRQIPGFKLDTRTVQKTGDALTLPPFENDDGTKGKVVADSTSFRGIGGVSGEFYVYDRDQEIRQRMSSIRMLESYLDENGGVRVYRDAIRVYNYGEVGDDWLGLDLRRVNIPTRRISRNIILGAVHLSLDGSTELIEKTNREGFVENAACAQLRRIVLGALTALETERRIDKERIRQLIDKPDDFSVSKFRPPIAELREELVRRGIGREIEPYVTRIETDYGVMQETLLSAGMSGLNLAVIFHEVERGVRALYHLISSGEDIKSLTRHAKDLTQILDGFSTLLRKDSAKRHTARKLITAAQKISSLRFRHHRIHTRFPDPSDQKLRCEAQFSFSLVLGALSNLIDNAIYWLRVRWPEATRGDEPNRKLYIGVSDGFNAGPAIVVADNGVGFQGDPPEHVVRPFFTRKPEGMGLGLYYANLTMELSGGQLVFPSRAEVEVPQDFDGAIVALVLRSG